MPRQGPGGQPNTLALPGRGAVRVRETRRVPLRAAAICGLLAPVTFVAGLLLGDLAQPDGFSPANDNSSDVGAQTADRAWLYNHLLWLGLLAWRLLRVADGRLVGADTTNPSV